MSNFTAIVLLMGLGIAATFNYFFFDKLIRDLSSTIVTGVLRGVPISTQERRLMFYRFWLTASAALVAYQIIIVIGWVLLAANVSNDDVKFYVYVCAFFGSMAVLGAIYQFSLGCFHLVSVLRQAEAA